MRIPLIEVLDELTGEQTARTINLMSRLPDERNLRGQLDSYEKVGAVEKVGLNDWRLTEKGRAHAERIYTSQGLDREQWLSLKAAMG